MSARLTATQRAALRGDPAGDEGVPQELYTNLAFVPKQRSVRGHHVGQPPPAGPASGQVVEQVTVTVEVDHIHIIEPIEGPMAWQRKKQLVAVGQTVREIGDRSDRDPMVRPARRLSGAVFSGEGICGQHRCLDPAGHQGTREAINDPGNAAVRPCWRKVWGHLEDMHQR